MNQPFDHAHQRWPEMVQYSFSDIHELRIFRWALDESEVAAIESGTIQIQFETTGAMRYLIMHLEPGRKSRSQADLQVEGLSELQTERQSVTRRVVTLRAPIAWWLLPTRDCPLPARGTPVRIVLVDGKSGVVKAVRELDLDTATETALVRSLQRQSLDTFGHLEMDAQLKRDLRLTK